MRFSTSLLGVVISAVAQWSVAKAGFINPSTCVDPTGFSQCYSDASTAAATCYAKNCQSGSCTDDNNCYTNDENDLYAPSCICVAYQSWLNCALSSCWNQVNSCDYQRLAIAAFENCPIAAGPIPYFPADPLTASDDVGGCSCPVGYVFSRIQDNVSFRIRCTNNITDLYASNQLTGAQDVAYGYGCSCCAASESVSLWYNICPNTSPSAWPSFPAKVGQALSVLQNTQCSKTLTTLDCRSDPLLGFPYPNDTKSGIFYDEDTIPPNGTESLSNLPGDLKTATSGATLVWTLVKGIDPSTAIAAPYSTPAGGAAPSSAVTGAGASTVGSGSGAGATTTGSALPASTSKSAGISRTGLFEGRLNVNFGIVLGMLFLVW